MKIEEINNRINKLENLSKFKNKILNPKNENVIFTIAIEFVSSIFVGFFLGLFLDKCFLTKPLFIILCTIIGSFASFVNINRKLNLKNAS